MNERERVEFDIVIGHLYKNLGEEMIRKLRPGMDYYRGLESKISELSNTNTQLTAELTQLKAELAYYKVSRASTAELPAIKGIGGGGTGKCRKSGICANWEPEPQTPGELSGVNGAALERDEDKHDTERLPTAGEKKSFFQKLFGG